MLDHARCESFCERLCCRVEVAQHDVAAPPTHKADRVCVDTFYEEGHGAAVPHWLCADVFWRESHLGSHEGGCGAQRCGDLRTADCWPCSSVETAAKCVSGVAPCCRRCATRRRMAATAHARGCPVVTCPIDSPLTPFFFVVKRRLTKVAAAQVAAEAVVAWVG